MVKFKIHLNFGVLISCTATAKWPVVKIGTLSVHVFAQNDCLHIDNHCFSTADVITVVLVAIEEVVVQLVAL